MMSCSEQSVQGTSRTPLGVFDRHYLTLVLNLPWDEPPAEVHLAAVKWMKDNNVGVEFLKVEDDDRVSIDVFLSSRSKLQGSPA